MEAILKFDLNDPQDRIEYMKYVKAPDMAGFIFHLTNVRQDVEREIENNENITPYEAVQLIFERMANELNRRGVNIEELM